jgi:hypothetical protein
MGPTIYPEAGDAPGIDTLFHIVPYNDFVLFMWIFNFFWVDMVIAKKINHRGHGGYRELLFSLCPLCSLWFFQNPILRR